MKDLKELQDLNIETNEECFGLLRHTEIISDADLYRTLAIYLLTLIVILSTMFLGPTCFKTIEKDFNATEKSQNIAFDVNIEGLEPNNKFLKFQISFPSENILENSEVRFKLALNSHQYQKSVLVHDIHSNFQNKTLKFVRGSKYSEALRVYSIDNMDFTSANSTIIISFEKRAYPVHFVATTMSASYTQLCDFIHGVGFIIGAIILIRLISFRYSFYINAIYFIHVLLLSIVLLICAIPRPLLQSFINKSLVTIVDIFTTEFLFVFTCFVGFIHLDAGKLVNQQINFTWAFLRSLFFIAFFMLMFIFSYKCSIKNVTDEIISPDVTTTGFSIAKYVLIALYIPFLYLINYMADSYNKFDQFVHFMMPNAFVVFTAVTEFLTPRIVNIDTNFSFQIYTFAAAISYILFYSFLNWPIMEKL